MDNLREKLIELIDEYEYPSSNPGLADHLIANGVTVQQWIPVTERLPQEHDSVFKQFAITEHWAKGMPMTVSDTVLAVVEYESGKRKVQALHTQDGHFHIGTLYKAKRVTHWMPLPELPKEVE